MRINNNLMAMNAQRYLSVNNNNIQKSIEKLSSGYRINRAGDDAAGLSISEKMRAQIRGLKMASKNSQDAISLIQTAEGALNETHAILQRMRELAVQAASDTNQDEDRKAIQDEIKELTEEINRIAHQTEFNEKKLLNGTLDSTATDGQSLVFQIGANNGQSIELDIANMDVSALNLAEVDDGKISKMLIDVSTQNGADEAITTIEDAIKDVSAERSKLGAYQNRLEHTINNLNTSAENLTAAESRIRDVDMADEMMEYTKNNILAQAATAMLAQANQAPQSVLQLLQ
ncbi:MAG: flagellin Hag [Clostridiaceae bacterium]|nr:flagellin Hag [Clostridiaceae bacterium]